MFWPPRLPTRMPLAPAPGAPLWRYRSASKSFFRCLFFLGAPVASIGGLFVPGPFIPRPPVLMPGLPVELLVILTAEPNALLLARITGPSSSKRARRAWRTLSKGTSLAVRVSTCILWSLSSRPPSATESPGAHLQRSQGPLLHGPAREAPARNRPPLV